MEGRRSILVEIQALVSPTNQAQPRRSIRGLDPTRVNQVLAVLDRHSSLVLHHKEVYVNVVGGWRIDEPVATFPSRSPWHRRIRPATGPVGGLGRDRPGRRGSLDTNGDQANRGAVDRMGLEHRVAPLGGKPLRLGQALTDAGL